MSERNNTLLTTFGNTDKKGSKSSEVSPRKQAQTSQTSPMVYNTGRYVSSQDLNILDKGTLGVGSKGSDKVISNDKFYIDTLYNGTTSLGSKDADRAVVMISLMLKVASIWRRPRGPREKVKGI